MQSVRLPFFLGLYGIFFLLEIVFPKRTQIFQKKELLKRLITNWGLLILGALMIRALPLDFYEILEVSLNKEFGLLSLFNIPLIIKVIISVITLDLVIYWQHRLFHEVNLLWYLHRVHHEDRDLDASSALRFHPLEILLSLFIKLAVVLCLGAPIISVLIFEILLNGMAIFNHSNLRLPLSFDKVLRLFVVTPDMHRIHHSVESNEMNSNYGFNISLWDRIFKSYSENPKLGQEKMVLGVMGEEERSNDLISQLIAPFKF